jgi:hypothetical protein
VTVDGTRLDTLAYNIETLDGRLTIPGVRGDNIVIPGRDGSIYVPNKSFDDGSMTLKMWVRGCDVDGAIPTTRMTEYRNNIATLTRLFGKRDSLLDVRQVWPAGTIQYLCEVRQAYDFAENSFMPKAKFAVELNIPGVFGQDVSTTDYTGSTSLTSGTTVTMAAYNGGTAPIKDAIIVVRGPATNPRLTNTSTGQWVQLSATIATGTDWRVNVGTWETVTGSAIGLTGTTGLTARIAETSYGGGGNQFLSLSPTVGGPQVTFTATGVGAATQILARARRKFLK